MAWSANSLVLIFTHVIALLYGKWVGSSNPRALDEETWERLRQKLDFSEKAPETSEINIDDPSSINFAVLMEVLRFAGIAIIVVLLVVIVIRLLAKNEKRQSKPEINREPIIEEIHIDTPLAVLRSAFEAQLRAENYREALRLLYQISVKKLAGAGMVKAHPDKTNWEYIAEIQEPEKASQFSALTLIYESHWYGDEFLSRQAFEGFHPLFASFIAALPDEEQ